MKSKDYEYLREAYSQVYSESGYFPTKESQKADEKKYRMGYTPVKHRTVQTQSKPPVKEDTFDAIKGHLIDEGFADTEQAALAIMANMSETWKSSIVESIAARAAKVVGDQRQGYHGDSDAINKMSNDISKSMGRLKRGSGPKVTPGGLPGV